MLEQRHGFSTADQGNARFIPLAKAVAQAHSRLFPEEPYKDPQTLRTIALALSALLPIYRQEPGGEEYVVLTEPELTAERLAKAAADGLLVPKMRFENALETIQIGSLDEARASLTLRQSPRTLSRGR